MDVLDEIPQDFLQVPGESSLGEVTELAAYDLRDRDYS